MDPEPYANLNRQDESDDEPAPEDFWECTQAKLQQAERLSLALHNHLFSLHEHIETLHERERDYATRLRNAFVESATMRSERDGLQSQLKRQQEKREAEREKAAEDLTTIRQERTHYLALNMRDKEIIRSLKAKNQGTTEDPVAVGKVAKVIPLALQESLKRRGDDEELDNPCLNKFAKPNTPRRPVVTPSSRAYGGIRTPLATKSDNVNRSSRILVVETFQEESIGA